MTMLEFAARLTADPCHMKETDVAELIRAGFEERDVLDIVQIVAYYNYVNRLACGLGVELEDRWDDE